MINKIREAVYGQEKKLKCFQPEVWLGFQGWAGKIKEERVSGGRKKDPVAVSPVHLQTHHLQHPILLEDYCFTGLLPKTCSACSLIHPKTTSPEVAPPTMDCPPPHQSRRKCTPGGPVGLQACGPIIWTHSLPWASFPQTAPACVKLTKHEPWHGWPTSQPSLCLVLYWPLFYKLWHNGTGRTRTDVFVLLFLWMKGC